VTPVLIHLPCPRCQRVIRAAAAMAGRTVACPGCELRLEVPVAPRREVPATSDSCIGGMMSPLYQSPAR
jgi:hypothetical protein